jgi:hypothetical protein
MKKNVFFAAALTLFIAAGITSCKKGTDAVLPKQKDGKKLTEFFEKYQRSTETFTVDAATGGVITTSKGSKLTIPAGAFKKLNGTLVTSGNVKVKVLDIFKPSDMLLNNKPTITTGGAMLESFGEIRVDATINDTALALNDKPIMVVMPVGNGAAGQQREIPMWNGIEPDQIQEYVMNGHNHLNQPTTVTQQVFMATTLQWEQINGLGAATPTQSTFPIDALGQWRNCDALYNDPRPKTTVLGYFGNGFNPESNENVNSYMKPSMLFFKTKTTNTLIRFTVSILNAAPGKDGFLSYQNSIPIGQEGTFLAITSKDDKFYAEMKDVTIGTPAAGTTFFGVDFNMTEVSESGLLNLINQLNTK